MVPKQYIVALWAIETDLGRVTGSDNVFKSLANLSFDTRRRKLFQGEFFAALEVAKQNQINAENFNGSWAGALGQCQFLPSTYLNHAYDYNKDGKMDVWNTKEDVFASIANYVKNLGWNNDLPWGYEIKNIKDLSEKINFKENHSLQYLVSKYNIKKRVRSKFTAFELTNSVKIVRQEDKLFITFRNFDLIKKWNNSTYFALTVGLLSDIIDK
jgi:membrane-bound lytic murein transglycosylase B